MAIGVKFRELLPAGVEIELDQLVKDINDVLNAEHLAGDGTHTDITADSIEAKGENGDRALRFYGNLRFLTGGIFLDEQGNNSHHAVLRPPAFTTTTHDYAPSEIDNAFGLEVSTDADRSLTGIKRKVRQKRLLLLGNRGNYNVTLLHDDSGSVYYNRFGLPGGADLVLASGEYVWLYYDTGSEVWRVLSSV